MALGRGGATFMTILAVIGLILNTSIAIVAASRLVFAVARDGVLPMSKTIGSVNEAGQPKNAVTVMYIFGALLLCVILPSQVAFTSLVSAGAIPTIAAYALIAVLRLTMTPNAFQNSYFNLGRWSKPFYLIAFVFNCILFSVSFFLRACRDFGSTAVSQVDISPFYFPVTDAESFNFACVIFGSVTIFGILSWYFIPEHKWLRREAVIKAMAEADAAREDEQ